MSNWRDLIHREFTANESRLTVVADPDGLLPEEDIFAANCKRCFKLIPFVDHDPSEPGSKKLGRNATTPPSSPQPTRFPKPSFRRTPNSSCGMIKL